MGVKGQGTGELLISDAEMEAASKFESFLHEQGRSILMTLALGFYHAFCFYKTEA